LGRRRLVGRVLCGNAHGKRERDEDSRDETANRHGTTTRLARSRSYRKSSKQGELPSVGLAAPWLRLLVAQQFRLDVVEKWRSGEGAHLAAPQALLGARENQPVLGARHADVEQPAFLGERGFVARAKGEGQNPIFESDDEHHCELESLRGMQG